MAEHRSSTGNKAAGTTAGRRRLPLFAVLLGLVVAVGSPTLWWVNRPAANAGVQITQEPAGDDQVTPGPTGASPTPGTIGEVGTRSARLPSATTGQPAPSRVQIPALSIDAPIDPVGVQPDGSMAIPEETREVGWYRYGPAPGARQGSAVLAGHVDSAVQGAGALFELRRIEVGDRIQVERDGGRTLTYRVTGKETIVKRRLPTERIFTRTGAERLVIITCGGPFIKELSSYRDNLVVVAVPEV